MKQDFKIWVEKELRLGVLEVIEKSELSKAEYFDSLFRTLISGDFIVEKTKTKICSGCKEEKIVESKNFAKCKDGLYNYRAKCKLCERAVTIARKEKNTKFNKIMGVDKDGQNNDA